MAGRGGFFAVDERLAASSRAGDPLERLAAVVDVELFSDEFDRALPRSDRAEGGRPADDAVLMVRLLVLQTLHTLFDEQTEYQVRDRLSFLRFLGLGLGDPLPDAKTLWLFREQLTEAGAIEVAFARFDRLLRDAGYLAMGGQIVDATVVEARRPRLLRDEKAIVKGGGVPEGWSKAEAAQIDRDGRWTLKRGRKRPPKADERVATELVVPCFGYNNPVTIDRRHGFVRRYTVTHAAAHDGAQLAAVLDPDTTASSVWADPLTGPRRTWRCSPGLDWWNAGDGRSRGAGRWRRTFAAATPSGPRSAFTSSSSSPCRSAARARSSAPSARRAPKPSSASPISSPTGSASPGSRPDPV